MNAHFSLLAASCMLSVAQGANTLPACGATIRRAHYLKNTEGYPERHYLIRLPSHAVCTTGNPLPLVLLIHCFGCMAPMEIEKYAAAADSYGFALVAPEGLHSSFNAPSCCGFAHENKLDDVGLVDTIVSALLTEGRFVATALFATGFSNGGFLTSHLADASRHAWAAIAPTAGHEYALRRDTPLPVFIHHCESDSLVNQSGCCMSTSVSMYNHVQTTPTCCCGIVAPSCVSTRAIFERWLRVNKCSSTRALPTHRVPTPHASCTVGVGCQAETALCLHAGGCRHPDWAHGFPAADAVLSFFGRQLCERHSGRRDRGR